MVDAVVLADDATKPKVAHDRLAAPVLLRDGKAPIDVDVGHATPYVVDWDGDGKKDLLVGQFSGGKIRVYRNLGDGKLATGDWLKADGAVAEIPGVW